MTMTIVQLEEQIINDFSYYTDWMEKYEYLISLGKSLPLIDAQYKTDQYIITGCQSQVWLHAAFSEGKVIFTADSDAIITKGIIALLIHTLSNQTPDDILQAEMLFIDKIGLKEHLSPTRSNGLVSMIKQMKLYALAFKSKQ